MLGIFSPHGMFTFFAHYKIVIFCSFCLEELLDLELTGNFVFFSPWQIQANPYMIPTWCCKYLDHRGSLLVRVMVHTKPIHFLKTSVGFQSPLLGFHKKEYAHNEVAIRTKCNKCLCNRKHRYPIDGSSYYYTPDFYCYFISHM